MRSHYFGSDDEGAIEISKDKDLRKVVAMNFKRFLNPPVFKWFKLYSIADLFFIFSIYYYDFC